MSEYRIGDVVIFGRKQGEKTLGTVTKVNRKTIKVSQGESRGTMKAHKIGTVWTIPKDGGLVRHATEAEAARLQEKDTEKAAPIPSQIPPRKTSAKTPEPKAPEPKAPEPRKINPRVISDGRKLPGAAMPGILAEAQKLVGLKIAQIGYISEDGENWPVVILEDGTELRAMRDDEINGPGSLAFGNNMLCEVWTH